MTVSTVVDHNDYTGNGVTTVFPYTFRVFVKSDLAVTVVDPDGNITQLVLDTDYTVTGAGGYSGGSIVLKSPLSNGWQISVARDLDPVQETDLRNQGKFFAETHEDVFDRLTMLIQQAFSAFRLSLRKPSSIANWYDALGNYIRNVRDPRDPQDAATKNYVDSLAGSNQMRTLRVPEPINSLPGVELRKNKMPAFDDGGNPIVVVPPSGSASDVMIDLAKPTGAGAIGYQYKNNSSSTKRTVRDKLDERVSLWDFHCDSNGNVIQPGPSVDSRQYIQNAIDYLNAKGGGYLEIPEGFNWFLGSYSTGPVSGHSGIIQLKSNVNISIRGKISLANYFKDRSFQIFVGFDNGDPAVSGSLNNVRIDGGGIIDFGGYPFKDAGHLRNGVTLGRSYNCSVTDITFQNGDVTWAVTVGWNGYGSKCRISKCKFINLVQDGINRDHSTVYVNAPHSGVNDCEFSNASTRAREIACTVELHQPYTWYIDSTITGYVRGCYVAQHGAESAGAGTYLYAMVVRGLTGDVAGQVVILAAGPDSSGVTTNINGLLIEGCEITAPNIPGLCSFIDFFQDAASDSAKYLINNVTVRNNNYIVDRARSLSCALCVNGSFQGMVFQNNLFDVKQAMTSERTPANAVNFSRLVWDESNIIGEANIGTRSGLNLFDTAGISKIENSTIDIRMRFESTDLYSYLYVHSYTSLANTIISIHPEKCFANPNRIVLESGVKPPVTVGLHYPATIAFRMSAGANAQRCTNTDGKDYSWVHRADSLQALGIQGEMDAPACYTGSTSGELVGIGWQLNGAQHDYTQWVMLHSR